MSGYMERSLHTHTHTHTHTRVIKSARVWPDSRVCVCVCRNWFTRSKSATIFLQANLGHTDVCVCVCVCEASVGFHSRFLLHRKLNIFSIKITILYH